MRCAYLLKVVALLGAVFLSGCIYTDRGRREDRVYREERVYRRPAPEPVVIERREPVIIERVEEDRPSEVVVTTFYEDLSPYGRWVEVGNYGRCWYPNGVERTWRPYTVGHWVHTDYGLTWVSEEHWGYATYHYGRWFEDSRYGWVWIPGSTWAPAWVAWRSGGGYVGWAPLGPSHRGGPDVRITEVETRDIPSSDYCFVEERHVTEPHVHRQVVNVQRNVTIINNTTNITNITRVNNTVINKSVTVEHVERATGRKVEHVTVKEATTATEAKRLREKGEAVQYRPKVLVEAERSKGAETKEQQLERLARERGERVKRRERDAQEQNK